MRPVHGGLDHGREAAGLVHQNEITDGGGFFFEPDRNLGRKEQDGGQEEEADPEPFGLGILRVLAPGD